MQAFTTVVVVNSTFWVTDQTDPVEKPWDDLNNPRSTSPRHLPAGTVPWSWPWLPTHTGSELVKTVAQVIGYVIEYTTGIHHPGWFCRNSASSVANPIANAAPKHVHSIQSYAQWPSWELCPEYLRQLCSQRQRFQWGKIRNEWGTCQFRDWQLDYQRFTQASSPKFDQLLDGTRSFPK